MTDQERRAARIAALFYRSTVGCCFPEPTENAIAVMHAVLTKHETDLRKHITKEIKRKCPGSPDALWVAANIVKPPEPSQPVLCKICHAPIRLAFFIDREEYVHVNGGNRMCGYAQPVAGEVGAS